MCKFEPKLKYTMRKTTNDSNMVKYDIFSVLLASFCPIQRVGETTVR